MTTDNPVISCRNAWKLFGPNPRQYLKSMPAGHGYEADVVYDWHGQAYVALVTRAGPSYVWARAVTYAEAMALGIA